MFKVVLLVTLTVLCVVHSQSDDGCTHSGSHTRVKRGKYRGPPLTYDTPPPFTPYRGSRPHKVSRRPTNHGWDDDINNLVNNLSTQDLDKIIEFAYEKDKYSDRSYDIEYEYYRPSKRKYSHKPPPFAKDYYYNYNTKYSEEKPYEMEFKKYLSYVTEATPLNYMPQHDMRSPYPTDIEWNQVSFPGSQDDRTPPSKVYSTQDNEPTRFQEYGPEGTSTNYKDFGPQFDQSSFAPQGGSHPFETFGTQDDTVPQTSNIDSVQKFENLPPMAYSGTTPSDFPETTEEETLPPPINMREVDFDASYTHNVPTVVKADSDSYAVENFGDLPLMNHNSKLHSVSSYHVPHYTVTKSKSQSLPPPPSSSYSSAANIQTPPVEPAPPVSAAQEQSDAHLKAIKIWSHKSKGAAYTLHDDGTLTPEWPRPKYEP
ncbi:uncharacterized protein LOC118276383 [Spodoptera frugiperda]|uniref:Uncharacterized protein LOC118276383 n=1 Tax=Spodoptera frugiperda TaxID=7108 RepID=A0A9R0DEY8_SPOFR|nr:uncharacterized protein LOC118276383 [Spodoptera frugiperda]